MLKPTSAPKTASAHSTEPPEISQRPLFWLGRSSQALRLLILTTLTARLLTMPQFIESGDGLFFARGVVRYSTYEVRPHWPGYPVYIWLGQLFHLAIPDPALALHLIAVLASSLSIWPIAALTSDLRREGGGTTEQAQLCGLIAGLTWALLPLPWLSGSEIYSDGVAIFVGLVLLWLSWRGMQAGVAAGGWLLPAAVLGGLLPGVRLSYFVLLLPLVYAVWRQRGQRVFGWPLPFVTLVAVGLSGITWFGWQLAVEGGRFFEASNNHLSGHFQTWGGSLLTDPDGYTRPVRLLYLTVVYGLGGWWPEGGIPLWRLPLSLLVIGLGGLGGWRLGRRGGRVAQRLLALWLWPYLLWVLVSHDLNIARYTFPVIALLAILVGLGWPDWVGWRRLALIAALAGSLALVTVPLALDHRLSPPVGESLAVYVNTQLDPATTALLLTENTPPPAFIHIFLFERAAAHPYNAIEARQLQSETEKLEREGRTVYTPWSPGNPPTGPVDGGKWVAVARFNQPRLLDSLSDLGGAGEVWLYRHIPTAPQP